MFIIYDGTSLNQFSVCFINIHLHNWNSIVGTWVGLDKSNVEYDSLPLADLE